MNDSVWRGRNRNKVATIFRWSESSSAAIVAWGGHREHLKSRTGTTARNSNFKRDSIGSLLAQAAPALAQKAFHICRFALIQSLRTLPLCWTQCPSVLKKSVLGHFASSTTPRLPPCTSTYVLELGFMFSCHSVCRVCSRSSRIATAPAGVRETEKQLSIYAVWKIDLNSLLVSIFDEHAEI